MNDIEAIRERHEEQPCCDKCGSPEWLHGTAGHRHRFKHGQSICALNGDSWRCDTSVVLDALDEMQQREFDVSLQRDAARADADRLAEALDRTARGYHDLADLAWVSAHSGAFDDCPGSLCDAVHNDLRLHDETAKGVVA